jgi:hypothetical protein
MLLLKTGNKNQDVTRIKYDKKIWKEWITSLKMNLIWKERVTILVFIGHRITITDSYIHKKDY